MRAVSSRGFVNRRVVFSSVWRFVILSHSLGSWRSFRPSALHRSLRAITLFVFELLSGVIVQADGPCLITNETDGFAILNVQQDANKFTTITWGSCTNYIYGVFSADGLNTDTSWMGQAAMWGGDRTTSWPDMTTTNLDHRFYRVVRMPPDGDFDGDGIPNAWELQYGLNPLDPSDAHADLDNDGADNLTEFLQGRDPTKGFVADSGELVNLNVFTPLE